MKCEICDANVTKQSAVFRFYNNKTYTLCKKCDSGKYPSVPEVATKIVIPDAFKKSLRVRGK